MNFISYYFILNAKIHQDENKNSEELLDKNIENIQTKIFKYFVISPILIFLIIFNSGNRF